MTLAAQRVGGIATSDPRATAAGARLLAEGASCVDAAVAAALVLFVVEPHHCGPGGDAFLLVQPAGAPHPVALDGAGAVPAGLDAASLAADGLERVPAFGARSVTVPGAPALLEEATRRWGTRSLHALGAPAVRFATEGFEVRPSLAAACAGSARRLAGDEVLATTYLRDGRPLAEGDRVENPALGRLLDELGRDGTESLYRGSHAAAIAAAVAIAGGYLDERDLAAHDTVEVAPRHVDYGGATVWELGPPTQGPAVLGALERLRDVEPDDWERVAEAIRLGLLDVGVDLVAAPWLRPRGGTSHVAVVDGDGGVASLITSVFAPFGSGLGVATLGGVLQNRAANFLLVDRDPSPGKPPHTIIPGLVTRDGAPEAAVGVAGGLMQAQGQVQLLVRMLGAGAAPDEAVAAPRLRVVEGGALALEPGHPLAGAHPDATGRDPGDGGFGCAQVASRRDGVHVAADHRRNGADEVVQVP